MSEISEQENESTSEVPEEMQNQGPVSVYTVMMMMLNELASIAWSKLGLQPDPITGKIEVDLLEAKVAIDVVDHIAPTIRGQLDEEDQRQLQNLVRDLKINYISKSKEGAV